MVEMDLSKIMSLSPDSQVLVFAIPSSEIPSVFTFLA